MNAHPIRFSLVVCGVEKPVERCRWTAFRAVLIGLLASALLCGVVSAQTERAELKSTTAFTGGRIIVETQGGPAAAPLIYSANAEQLVRYSLGNILGQILLKIHIIQGKPELFTLGLEGDGEITRVSGRNLRDWSLRKTGEAEKTRRWLDLRPDATGNLEVVISTMTRIDHLPLSDAPLMVTKGDAESLVTQTTLKWDSAVRIAVERSDGMFVVDQANAVANEIRYLSWGNGSISVRLTPRGTNPLQLELDGTALTGTLDPKQTSVQFQLVAKTTSARVGARAHILSGHAAPAERVVGDGWHVELMADADGQARYDLVSDREGALSIALPLVAAVRESKGWRQLEFAMPAGAIVPITLEGLGSDVSFEPDAAVVPVRAGDGWRGFLPADGGVALAWKNERKAEKGALFFTSSETDEVSVAAGVLRQTANLALRVLQGSMGKVRCRLAGDGTIVGVTGAAILNWHVNEADGTRWLEVNFGQSVDGEVAIIIQTQQNLGVFPAKVEPLRILPEGGVRHSGVVRLSNHGAVRLELADVTGMMQLAANQFNGPALENASQVFVYRFPAESYHYAILASQIQPEVSVEQTTIYELGETDRVIDANLELEVREAPLRDWTIEVPGDYSVVSITGAEVADYAVQSGVEGGVRRVKVLFRRAVEGQVLLQMRMEKNQVAAAGIWKLVPLRFPDVKTVRGSIAVGAAAGFRLSPAHVEKLAELPVSYFPRQVAGLQQAWRLRDGDWAAEVRADALGQSIQADVFQLYTLKEGVTYGSILLNYYVVGSPATEWRVQLPPAAGNIDVVGHNLRRDWHRDGDLLVVGLHQPVLGPATALVTFELPVSARAATFRVGEVRPVGVQSERGYIEVVSPVLVRSKVVSAEGGLLPLEAAELPTEYRLLSSYPAIAVYQYTGRPISMEMAVDWSAPVEPVEQVVDFAKVSSQISRDGQIATEAQYYVKTRGHKAFRVALPPGAKLWEARVDGEVVTARAEENQVLLPLEAKANLNDPSLVSIRLGQSGKEGETRLHLAAPQPLVPTVSTEWTLHADAGRVLIPRGGNAQLVAPVLADTGFEWIAKAATVPTLCTLILLGIGAYLMRGNAGGKFWLGAGLAVTAGVLAIMLAGASVLNERLIVRSVTYAATALPKDLQVWVDVDNVKETAAAIVGWGVLAGILGTAALVLGTVLRRSKQQVGAIWILAGELGLAVGILAQPRGAPWFYLAVAGMVLAAVLIPGMVRWWRARRMGDGPIPPSFQSVVPGLMIVGILGLLGWPTSRALANSDGETVPIFHRTLQSCVQSWRVEKNQVVAEAEITVRGKEGETFVMLKAPAIVTQFKSENLRIGKGRLEEQAIYFVELEKSGEGSAHVSYVMSLDDDLHEVQVPVPAAALHRLEVVVNQPGWSFLSASAVEIKPLASVRPTESGAILLFAAQDGPKFSIVPKARDVTVERTQFYAEVTNLFLPGPGVVNGLIRVKIRPSQGQVTELDLEVPAGLSVGDVSDGPVTNWRFDAQKRRIHLTIDPAQSVPFQFDVQTQAGTGDVPFGLSLEPLRVVGTESGDVGLLGIAFAGETQPEEVVASEAASVGLQDFDTDLLKIVSSGGAAGAAHLQKVWRYGQTGGKVTLRVAPVAPEIRVNNRELITLDEDRLVVALDLGVQIARVGLFRLSFNLPEGLEVETVSGAALNHWTQANDGGRRIVALHLNGRTIGEQKFAITLTGTAPKTQDAWPVPKIVINEATRQTGDLILVPGRGLRLRPADRESVTQLDPRALGAVQPGTLAYHLLDGNWKLAVGVEALEPWVTVQSLQELTVREGQTLARIAAHFRVESAGVKRLKIRIPGLDGEHAGTLHASGALVGEIVRLVDQPEMWEVHFRRSVAGETDVTIEYVVPPGQNAGEQRMMPCEFPDARQVQSYVAIRATGRMDLEASQLPRGWSRVDWSAVPAVLHSRSERTLPSVCLRVAEPEGPALLSVRRQNVADALRLRVTGAELWSVLSARGDALTAVELRIEVLEKSAVKVVLPEQARLLNVFVNNQAAPAVNDGEALRLYVEAGDNSGRSAVVRFVYSTPPATDREIVLKAPNLSVPMENVVWRVSPPTGYQIYEYKGDLRMAEAQIRGDFSLEKYRSVVESRRSAEVQKASEWMQEASSFLQKGNQQKAGEALSRASKAQLLDEASNEDARVQLKNLRTQQTLLGLTTRRQRLYLDNKGDVARNEQLELAASANPYIQGKIDFDPTQFDQLLMGNSVEENTALRAIATKLVDQQAAVETTAGAIDIVLPDHGRSLVFGRSLQMDGGKVLALRLWLRADERNRFWPNLWLIGAILSAAALPLFGASTASRRNVD